MTPPIEQPNVTVYWRPGCGFCSSLLYRLEQSEIVYSTVDIWKNPEGAAYVRSVARGNETVPTVTVDGKAMVNPSFRQLVTAVSGEQPPRRFGLFR